MTQGAYMVVSVDFDSDEVLASYVQQAMPALETYRVEVLAATSEIEQLDGDWPRRRIAILGFPSMDDARAFWNAPEYAAARAYREAHSAGDIVIVPALPGAQSCARYVLGRSTADNYDWVAEYEEKDTPVSSKYGLVTLAFGEEFDVLDGEWGRDTLALFGFPSEQAYRDFWYGEEYAPMKALRMANMICDHIAFAAGFDAPT